MIEENAVAMFQISKLLYEAANSVGQSVRGTDNERPRNRATDIRIAAAPKTLIARKVQTETSRIANGKSGQLVPHKIVRITSNTSARGETAEVGTGGFSRAAF